MKPYLQGDEHFDSLYLKRTIIETVERFACESETVIKEKNNMFAFSLFVLVQLIRVDWGTLKLSLAFICIFYQMIALFNNNSTQLMFSLQRQAICKVVLLYLSLEWISIAIL